MNDFDGGVRRPPHLLQIVEGPDFWFKKMDDHIASIDDNPVAILLALHPDILKAQKVQPLRKLHREGIDVPG